MLSTALLLATGLGKVNVVNNIQPVTWRVSDIIVDFAFYKEEDSFTIRSDSQLIDVPINQLESLIAMLTKGLELVKNG